MFSAARLPFIFFIIFVGLLLSACSSFVSIDEPMSVIEGDFYYREKIALAPDGNAIVYLVDISRADAPAEILAKQKIPLTGQQVPISYQLKVNQDTLDPRFSYAIRVEIRNSDSKLLWTSDQVYPVQAGVAEQVVPSIRLVRVEGDSSDEAALLNTEWQVEDINGTGVVDRSNVTILFSDDGQIYGNAGCNQYSAGYKINKHRLEIGLIRVTQRACIPALSAQETSFLDALQNAEELTLDLRKGLIKITSRNASSIVATQK